jgi:hypothetical protein
MAAKKRSAPTSHRKRFRASDEDGDLNSTQVAQNVANRKKKHHGRLNPQVRNQLVYGVGVLIIAIIIGVLWNILDVSADPRVRRFWSLICRTAQCARFVTPVRRTLHAARPIRSGEIISEIPRDQQIWDIDALRDDFVQTHLLSARHSGSLNRLSSGAFLAAYLALQYHQLLHPNDNTTTLAPTSVDPIRTAYLDALPTLEESSDHPLFWSPKQVVELLGRGTLTAGVVLTYHGMVASEYDALSLASPIFGQTISKTNYTLARVWVLSRSFSPGAAGLLGDLSDEERSFLQENVGTNFSKGCHAMVPILDLLNHHPSPNVVYQYNPDKRAFVVTAKRRIPASFELYDSYGRFSDSHLLAKFGFLNGDGSGSTQISMAFFHRVIDLGGMSDESSYLSKENAEFNQMILEAQRPGIVSYLQFDDGYEDCVPGPDDSDAYRLKKLKLQHIIRIANDPTRWIVTMGPRRPKSQPREASNEKIMDEAPVIDTRNAIINVLPLIETCRLMSVIHTDFEGDAISLLERNLETPIFRLDRDSDALEYRAFAWYVLGEVVTRTLHNLQTNLSSFGPFKVWLD